jgi:hypothetical protein
MLTRMLGILHHVDFIQQMGEEGQDQWLLTTESL